MNFFYAFITFLAINVCTFSISFAETIIPNNKILFDNSPFNINSLTDLDITLDILTNRGEEAYTVEKTDALINEINSFNFEKELKALLKKLENFEITSDEFFQAVLVLSEKYTFISTLKEGGFVHIICANAICIPNQAPILDHIDEEKIKKILRDKKCENAKCLDFGNPTFYLRYNDFVWTLKDSYCDVAICKEKELSIYIGIHGAALRKIIGCAAAQCHVVDETIGAEEEEDEEVETAEEKAARLEKERKEKEKLNADIAKSLAAKAKKDALKAKEDKKMRDAGITQVDTVIMPNKDSKNTTKIVIETYEGGDHIVSVYNKQDDGNWDLAENYPQSSPAGNEGVTNEKKIKDLIVIHSSKNAGNKHSRTTRKPGKE